MLRIGYRMPLGLTIRPAARVIRELPPSPETYRVAVFFRAAPLAAPTFVRSTDASVENKKPLSLTPVEEPPLRKATPYGVGIRLNGLLA